MKKVTLIFLCLGVYLCSSSGLVAQEKPIKADDSLHIKDMEEDGPLVFKFEPDYIAANEKRREELRQKKELIYSMDISEAKRKKLLRDLYKTKASKRLLKVLSEETKLVDTKFEENKN